MSLLNNEIHGHKNRLVGLRHQVKAIIHCPFRVNEHNPALVGDLSSLYQMAKRPPFHTFCRAKLIDEINTSNHHIQHKPASLAQWHYESLFLKAYYQTVVPYAFQENHHQ